MRPLERGRIRHATIVIGAMATLLLGTALPAYAAPGPATPKDPSPTKSGQGVPAGVDSFEAMKAVLGVQGMKNQEDLNAYKAWLIAQPGIVDQGFYESTVKTADRTMTLQWNGTSPLQASAVAEGKRRGLKVVVKRVNYTKASVDRAMSVLLDPANAAKLGGFQVTSVAGPTLDRDALTVSGIIAGKATTTAGDVDSRVSSMAPAVKALTGLDATFVPGRKSVSYATRSTDFSPYNAGGMIRGNNGSGCTSGFGILRSGYTWTTTARHCDADSWTAWDNSANSYGSKYSADAGTGNRMLTGDGFFWTFDGAWNNATGFHKTVWGASEVNVGTAICSSGANSGVHCNLVVENLNESFNDGYGTFSSIRVHAQSGIAGAHGDSGGPMFIPASDGTHVWAVGMLQGSNQAQISSCGSLRIATQCSAWVEYTSITKFLANMGATLYTG